MSTISTFHPFTCPIYKSQIRPTNISFLGFNCQRNAIQTQNFSHLRLTLNSKFRRVRSSEENDQISEIVAEEDEEQVGSTEQVETVAVPVSPADKLLMFFQAEGTMSDSAVPKVTQALEGTEGISDLKVHISEGIATVELTKQTTIQATGVASGLLETIQGSGFKLNTLNLSFEDEELLPV